MRRLTSMAMVFCACYGGAAAGAGTLNISSEPSGATVSLDGKRIGRAPCKVAVPAGEHTVTASAKRYDSDSKVVNIKDGKETSVQLTLLPTPIDIKVKCSVKGATVYVDGVKVGMVNEAVKARPGTRELAVVKDGFKDYVRQIRIPWKTSGKKPKTYSVKLTVGTSFRSGALPLEVAGWRGVRGWRFMGGRMVYDSGDAAWAVRSIERPRTLALMCRYRAVNVRFPQMAFVYAGTISRYQFLADDKWHVLCVQIDGREASKTTDGSSPKKTFAVGGSPVELRLSAIAPENNDPFRVEISTLVIQQFKSVAEMKAALGQ